MFTLNCRGTLLVMDKPIVMGIINVTPDSFYTGSRQMNTNDVVKQAAKMLEEGAAIIDIGGASTRPGSEMISEETELSRVIPAIEAVISSLPGILISIDTYRSTVAEAAINAGASIVNDISAGAFDDDMHKVVARYRTPYIMMHMRGVPATMQNDTSYNDMMLEILDYFIKKIDDCKQAGIHDIIIDPGFGFAKNIKGNFELLKKLEVLKILDKPILIGLSRKSTIYKTLNITAEESLNGTSVLHTIALLNGANILRVHDVREAVQAVKLYQEYLEN